MRPNSNNKLITRLQINKTEKSFSLIGCAINDKSYKILSIWQLTAWRLTDNRLILAYKQEQLMTSWEKLQAYKAAHNYSQLKNTYHLISRYWMRKLKISDSYVVEGLWFQNCQSVTSITLLTKILFLSHYLIR